MSLEPELDRLFAQPLDAFVEARNALAARLKASGEAAASAQVKALAKPSVSAWAVNQLARLHPDLLATLYAAGAAVRAAQAGEGTLNEAVRRRREAVQRLTEAAAKLLESGGHGSTAATLQRVGRTLEALAAFGEDAGAPQPGRLVRDLEPPGFEAFAGFSPPPPRAVPERPPARARAVPVEVAPVPDADEEARAESARVAEQRRTAGRERLALAVAKVSAGREELRRSEAARADAEREAARAERDAEVAERRAAEARARLERTLAERDSARAGAAEAGAVVSAAEREHEEARAELARLEAQR